ncbi:hypothetical protein [Sphingobium terrigena]|uniref:hypothetical protein n=1 Tax=Sphingobium terrigena TaxID=2304063 RepID=UPI0011C3C630|nr:hypothetical protein [Sphingobium terrigena]
MTEREVDLVNLLLVRAAFWQAWQGCVKNGRGPDCAALRQAFREAAVTRLAHIQKQNFRRDVVYYQKEELRW